MEAKCKHEFQATAADELSFSKDDIIKILDRDDDVNWYKAELHGREGYIPSNYIEMEDISWFCPKLKRQDAEATLLEQRCGVYLKEDGAFMVRPSESSPGDFSLSVKFGGSVQHFKVLRDGAGKYFLWVVKFNSLNELVQYHKTASVSRSQTIYLKEMPKELLKACYDFKPQDAEELELKKGEIITVIDKNDVNWWKGELTRNGKKLSGVFPSTYVIPYKD